MRWLSIGIMAAFVAVIAIFAIQNLQNVTVSFLGFSMQAPVALIAILVYLLGMATGGSLRALLRRSFAKARRGRA